MPKLDVEEDRMIIENDLRFFYQGFDNLIFGSDEKNAHFCIIDVENPSNKVYG